MSLDRIRTLEEGIDAAEALVARHREVAEKQILSLLPTLTQDELMELAEECDEESGPRHCYRCAAFALTT